jgi:outer membrane receptor for ferrienterochelin and colicin
VVLSEVLTTVPGVKLSRADRGAQKRSEITFSRGMSSMRQCMPAIFIDGALMRSGGILRPNELPLDEWVNPRDIEGIELYHGAAATPAIYNQQAQCGVVVIWTKRRK